MQVVPRLVYPDLPLLDKPPVACYPFEFAFPLRPDGSVDKTSNLYIGLTEDNFKALRLTLECLRGAISARDARIDAVNAQREDWRSRNKKDGPPVISP